MKCIILVTGAILAILCWIPAVFNLSNTTKYVFTCIFLLLILGVLGFNVYLEKRKSAYSGLFVTPNSYIVKPNRMDEDFEMIVTNNFAYPLYKVVIRTTRKSGDIPTEDILISLRSDSKSVDKLEIVSDDKISKEVPKEDTLRVILFNDNGEIKPVGRHVRRKNGEVFRGFLIGKMGANSEKSYPVRIHKSRCTKLSKITFEAVASSKNPIPNYSAPGEKRFVWPKDGHY